MISFLQVGILNGNLHLSDTLSSLWFRIAFFSHLVVTSDSVCLSMELWKESLHSDGKLYHHNQQNEQLPLNSNH